MATAAAPESAPTPSTNGTTHGTAGPAEMAPQKTMEKLTKTTLLSATTWDIFSPPPSNSFKGKVVPRVMNRYKHRRKISVEVHKIAPLVASGKKKGDEEVHPPYEECVVRILVPVDRKKHLQEKKEALSHIRGDSGTVTSLKEIHLQDDDEDDVSTEASSIIGSAGGILADTGGKNFDGWKPRYRIPVQALTIKQTHKKSVHVLVDVQKLKQERELIFDSLEDATSFCQIVTQECEKEIERKEARLHASLGDIKLAPFETVTLLIEIVSGWNLPIGDIKSSDPYVICMMGHREVHRTKHIPNTLDPIWTIKNGSLFLLTVESRQLFIEEGLNLLVKDFDQFGHNETLGIAMVPPRQLYKANGERMEFKLQPVPGKTDENVPGYVAIRCRRASEYDKRFMESYEASLKAVIAQDHPKVKNNTIKSIVTRHKKMEDGVRLYKIRPKPDPERADETEWLSKKQIEDETMKPSRHWTDAGTGNLGKIYLEILGCDGLPNLDTGGFLGNKTDAFVSVVYEDVYLRTDTIDDCLSPRWLPWAHRAFMLNIGHPSSQISLGVFDFDAGLDDHDLIGRVSVDITNLRKDTDYVLAFNIFPSARITGREIQGKIHIRLRIEIPDERKMVLASLEPPVPVYVNVKKKKDFRVIRQTCLGKYDIDKYSIHNLKSYVDELREYQRILFYLEDALMTLLLWRGHYALQIGSKEFLAPLHSVAAFVIAILLVENPQYYPSFCFACISWLLFAVMGWRRNTPDVWGKCYSYAEMTEKLLLGRTTTPPQTIKAFEGFQKAKVAMEVWLKRVADAEAKAEQDYIVAQEIEQERLKELEEIGDADGDISTKVGGGGIVIDPIKAALYPVQLMLGIVCRALRFVKHIVYWEEAYFAFWIATGSMILAVTCLFVPWFFIIKWTSRILVWTLFGPWMKLVDVFYVSTLKPETEDEKKARALREKFERKLATTKAASEARVVRENATKMKAMKKYMFGKFAMKVPILKQDRYSDKPLPESSAAAHKMKTLTLAELAMQEAGYKRTRLPGQTLVGDMIPQVETQSFTLAPVGQATASPNRLAKNAPGGGTKKKPDSTAAAYMKIGMIVVTAAVLTFFGVPILASSSKSFVGMLGQVDFKAFTDRFAASS